MLLGMTIHFPCGKMFAKNDMKTIESSIVIFNLKSAISTVLLIGLICGFVNVKADNSASKKERYFGGEGEDFTSVFWGIATNIVVGETHVSGVIHGYDPKECILQVGICLSTNRIFYSNKSKMFFPPIYEVLLHSSTNSRNKYIPVYLPNLNEQFDINIVDQNGSNIKKTLGGISIGKSDTLAKSVSHNLARKYGYKSFPLWPNQTNVLREISIGNMFSIKTPGSYKMLFTQRVYIVNTNTFLKAITLPSVSVNIEVDE
jgi:hypothetical protein